MTDKDCAEMQLLVQADVDGELSAHDAAGVATHLEHCAACAKLQADMIGLSGRIREEAPYHRAPDALRAAVRGRLAAMTAPPAAATIAPPVAAPLPPAAPVAAPIAAPVAAPIAAPTAANDDHPSWWRRLPRPRLRPVLPFGGGFALAACLALLFLLPSAGGLPDAVVSDHIRALQPGHLMDVVSTDQHTVKPWFDGRLDFAPPVKDFKTEGFPLTGGRLDYVAGHQAAALIYQRRQHVINVYVWPDGGHFDHGPTSGSRSGYNFEQWSRDGMSFWAVSDLGADELADFVRLWRAE